jgi:hypothetical protein
MALHFTVTSAPNISVSVFFNLNSPTGHNCNQQHSVKWSKVKCHIVLEYKYPKEIAISWHVLLKLSPVVWHMSIYVSFTHGATQLEDKKIQLIMVFLWNKFDVIASVSFITTAIIVFVIAVVSLSSALPPPPLLADSHTIQSYQNIQCWWNTEYILQEVLLNRHFS